MDITVYCVLLAQLSILFLSTTNARTWFRSVLETPGKCKFSVTRVPMYSDQLESLVVRNATNDTLHLPYQLTTFFYTGHTECPMHIIVDESATYKLEEIALSNLPMLPGNIHRLRALKSFECKNIYSSITDIAILNNMTQLETISLHTCVGMTISHTLHLPSLQRLNIDTGPVILFNNVVCDFPELTDLRLYNNSLEVIPSYFSTFKKLTRIELNRNKLLSIIFDVFNKMTELVSLILVRNQISEIVSENPVKLPRLRWLHLDGNNLAVLNVTLWITPALQWLSLANNQLTQVPSLLTLFRGKVISLAVRDNPWDCGWLNQTIENIPNATVVASSEDLCRVKYIFTKNQQE